MIIGTLKVRDGSMETEFREGDIISFVAQPKPSLLDELDGLEKLLNNE